MNILKLEVLVKDNNMNPGIYNMDCIEAMKKIKANSVSSIVTDPPYGIGFMGKEWDTFKPGYKPDNWKGYEGDARLKNGSMIAGKYNLSLKSVRQYQDWCHVWALECIRILKPGGHLLASNSSRMYHRMAVAIEDAGFEIRDQIMWVYGSGFPKSLDVGKAIDKRNGRFFDDDFKDYCNEKRKEVGLSLSDINKKMGTAETGGGFASCVMGDKEQNELPTLEMYRKLKEILKMDDRYGNLIELTEAKREVIGKKEKLESYKYKGNNVYQTDGELDKVEIDITKPSTPQAQQWDGWGTALKPAHEPIVVARKPLDGTVANNILKWGTGGINIDGCRIGTEGGGTHCDNRDSEGNCLGHNNAGKSTSGETIHAKETGITQGRFPSNLIHDGSEEVEGLFPEVRQGNMNQQVNASSIYGSKSERNEKTVFANDYGSASRFFYCAKASGVERNYGMTDKSNSHPTIKPLDLMRYLVRLVTPANGICVDPFMGSGTTGMACKLEGFDFIGIDKEKEYCDITKGRIEAISQIEIDKGELILPEEQNENQIDMFK